MKPKGILNTKLSRNYFGIFKHTAYSIPEVAQKQKNIYSFKHSLQVFLFTVSFLRFSVCCDTKLHPEHYEQKDLNYFQTGSKDKHYRLMPQTLKTEQRTELLRTQDLGLRYRSCLLYIKVLEVFIQQFQYVNSATKEKGHKNLKGLNTFFILIVCIFLP